MKQYIQFRREGQGGDLSEVMQTTGMGRGIYRMGKRFGVLADTQNDNEADNGR
jgi:hypothetical protein